MLHESQLLYTDRSELYACIAILGVEYTINLGGPEIDGYLSWLVEHDNISPLYPNGGIYPSHDHKSKNKER